MKPALQAFAASPFTDWAARLAVGAFYTWLLYVHGTNFHETGRLSSLFLVVLETIVVGLFISRKRAQLLSTKPLDWCAAAARTILPAFLIPSAMMHESVVLQLIQALGTCVTVAGACALNQSIGVVPANRGIKTNGIYCCIRHPFYAGYLLSLSAFLAQNPHTWNAALVVLVYALIGFSVIAEESLLRQDPEYIAYAAKTRWRLLPFIW